MAIFDVGTEAELRDAIFAISNDFATDGAVAEDHVINITADIDLTQSLPMIRGDGVHTITIEGNGFTVDAQSSGRVFFIESGNVAINDVTIADAVAQGGNGGDGALTAGNPAFSGSGGGGGLGAGAAVFVNAGATVTLSDVTVEDASAAGGAGGNGGSGISGGGGGGGGGGLGGDGGDGTFNGPGGGGGYEGAGGDGAGLANPGGGGGGGEFGTGGLAGPGGSGGGGGGQQGSGGAGAGTLDGGGGGGGGATDPGAPASGTTGGSGGGAEGGDGGDQGQNGAPGQALGGGGGAGAAIAFVGGNGGAGGDSGGGGGGGTNALTSGGNGGVGGGGGGALRGPSGIGGAFGGGGANTGFGADGGDGGFGGGGAGTTARDGSLTEVGGTGGFGAGGGGGSASGAAGTFGGAGGSGLAADGGGGAALGGAVFVREGGTLILKDTSFNGSYGVTGGTTGGTGGAQSGAAHGAIMFLHQETTTTIEVTTIAPQVIAGDDFVAGDIAGSGNLEKTGAGTLILAGANTYTGATIVSEGTLALAYDEALSPTTAVTVGSLGILHILPGGNEGQIGSLAGSGIVSIGSNSLLLLGTNDQSTTFSGIIDATHGSFGKLGDGTFTFTGAGDVGFLGIEDGGFVIDGGSLTANQVEISVDDGPTDVTVTNGGSLTSGTPFYFFNGSLSVTAGGIVTVLDTGAPPGDPAVVLDGDLTIDGAGSVMTVETFVEIGRDEISEVMISNGGVLNTGAAILMTLAGAPIVILTGVNSAWNVAGVLDLGGTGPFGADVTVEDQAVLQAAQIKVSAGSNLVIGEGGLAGQIDTPTIENNGDIIALFSDEMTLSAAISGNGQLTMAGSGLLILTGNNSFAGETFVDEGTLRVNGTHAGSPITVESGGTLGGNGTTGLVSVQAGGMLGAGASAGVLTTGSVSLTAGAVFEAELGGTTAGQYDQVKVNGTVALGGATLDLLLLGGFSPFGTSFTIIDNDGNDAVSGTFAGLAQGASISVGSVLLTISYTGGDGNDVALTALSPPGVIINGTPEADIVNATQTVAGQPLPSAFDDVVNGFGGDDSLNALAGNDQIFGGRGDDQLLGEDGNDVLFGAKGRDELFGGLGADFLSGGFGRNRLTGGTDADQFVFDSKLGKGKDGTNNKSSFSKITDFTDGDLIELSQSVFKKIALGVLSDAAFRDIGEKATKETRITYKASGELSYDKDGNGGAAGIVFAKLTTKPDIDASDFLVVA